MVSMLFSAERDIATGDFKPKVLELSVDDCNYTFNAINATAKNSTLNVDGGRYQNN